MELAKLLANFILYDYITLVLTPHEQLILNPKMPLNIYIDIHLRLFVDADDRIFVDDRLVFIGDNMFWEVNRQWIVGSIADI